MIRLAVLVAALAAGCYSPAVPSAGYLCGSDGSCPQGLSCVCGACVSSPSEAACSLTLEVHPGGCMVGDGDSLCVTEGQAFPVTITAFADANHSVPSSYSGTATFASSWGNARATAPFTFEKGVATASVALDRASPSHKTYLTVIAGTGIGQSATGIFIDPPPFTFENAPVLAPPVAWATDDVGLPAIDHGPSGYTLYFAGANSDGIGIGSATSPDGTSWTPAPQPLLPPEKGKLYYSPSVLRLSPTDVRLFYSVTSFGAASDLGVLSSSDGGKSFGPQTILPTPCASDACNGGIQFPWLLPSPISSSEWLLYFTRDWKSPLPTIGIARSVDGGQTWATDTVQTPDNRLNLPRDAADGFSARVLYDARTGIYRMWFAQAVDKCNTVINYATSTDGQFWTGTREAVLPITIGDVGWAKANPAVVGLLPGAIEPPDPASSSPHYTLWFSALMANPSANLLFKALLPCVPIGIGRATRP